MALDFLGSGLFEFRRTNFDSSDLFVSDDRTVHFCDLFLDSSTYCCRVSSCGELAVSGEYYCRKDDSVAILLLSSNNDRFRNTRNIGKILLNLLRKYVLSVFENGSNRPR